MLPSSRSLLTPTPLRAMAVRPPPRPPNRGRPSFPRPPACGAVARAAPSLSAATAVSSPPPAKRKVLVPIAMGTEEMEAIILAGVLRRAGADVTLASVEDGLEVEASCGSRIVADMPIAACADQVFDLVALPGGMPGSVRLRDNEILQRITIRQAEEKRLYGAICAAPAVVLMPWGLHKRKKITCHPSFIGDLPTFRAVESNVQVSGELTTSRGPGTSFQFALSFVEQLFGPCAAEDMGCTLMTQVDDNLERSVEVNEIDWSSDHNPHGGTAGAEMLHRSRVLKKLLKEQKQTGRMYGGICSSPVILQKQGLLQDKSVTAHPSIVNQLTCEVIHHSKVVIDGNLITGMGLGTVIDFSLAIIKKFFGHGRAKGVANGIVFEYPKKLKHLKFLAPCIYSERRHLVVL